MKTLKVIIGLLVFFLAGAVQSQVSVNAKTGSPPPWGPVGYAGVRYYYLPDVEAYYDVQSSMFIYYTGGSWVHKTYLPSRYSNYDLYSGYKVVMTGYRGNTPYTHFTEYKSKYARGYRDIAQKTIGERPGKGNSKTSDNHGNDKNVSHGSDNGMKIDSDRGAANGKTK